MRASIAIAVVLALAGPIVAIALLSLSPSSGMDFYARPTEASLRWWAGLLGDPDWAEATITSASVASISAAIAMIVSLPAIVATRLSPRKWKEATLVACGLSITIPPVVMAVALYGPFSQAGLFDTIPGLSIAHLTATIPTAMFVMRQRLLCSTLTPFLVARATGASVLAAVVTWLKSTHRATLVAAFGAAFMASLSEATLTIFLTDTRVLTLPRQVISSLAQDIDPTGYAAMTLWMLVVVAGIATVTTLAKRENVP